MTSGVNRLPQDLRTPDLLNRDLDPREGKVLLLHGLVYTAKAIGTGSHYSTRLETGDLIDLNSIPERQRAELREGQDYITKWTKEDVIRVQAEKAKMPKVCHSTMNSEHMPVDVDVNVNVEHLLKVLRYDIEKTALCLVLLEVMGQEPADCNLGLVGEHVDSVRRELRKALGLQAERF